MKKLNVNYSKWEYQAQGANPDDDWDRGITDSTISLKNLQEVGEDVSDIVAEKDSDNYYFLYVIFETGDSFGREGGNFEPIGAYVDFDVAEKNRSSIEEHYNYFQSSLVKKDREKEKRLGSLCSINLLRENGDEFSMHVPWTGFFEFLQTVEIEVLPVVNLPREKS